jgi:hypothetical protein
VTKVHLSTKYEQKIQKKISTALMGFKSEWQFTKKNKKNESP